MASNSTKSFLADAGYGEQELDANSALMELDKGLRSGKLGEQCEAVVRFPRLFQKYPFPILINSAFLKLADVFRVGPSPVILYALMCLSTHHIRLE
uniref:Integrator complex subunit 7 n=1 Tax=Rhinolophus ferrumequinum TaxID=59479 RepID=A0A671FIR3_RHIFE